MDCAQIISLVADVVTALSLIGTIIALNLTRIQMKQQVDSAIVSNHIELRKLFAEGDRIEVHTNLRPGGKWCNNNCVPTTEEWIKVEDYMGLLETAEFMLSKKSLDNEMFKATYAYRLKNLCSNGAIRKKICSNRESWQMLNNLLERYSICIKENCG